MNGLRPLTAGRYETHLYPVDCCESDCLTRSKVRPSPSASRRASEGERSAGISCPARSGPDGHDDDDEEEEWSLESGTERKPAEDIAEARAIFALLLAEGGAAEEEEEAPMRSE